MGKIVMTFESFVPQVSPPKHLYFESSRLLKKLWQNVAVLANVIWKRQKGATTSAKEECEVKVIQRYGGLSINVGYFEATRGYVIYSPRA